MYSDVLRTTTNYQFRLVSEERFNTRVNILKYNSWFIINLYWFQPDKGSKRRLKLAKIKRYTSTHYPNLKTNATASKLNKMISLSNPFKTPAFPNYNF